MKRTRLPLAAASVLAAFVPSASAQSLDDVQFWAGTGTNRAALVIHWSAPEVRNNTYVPNPAAEKSLVWGFRWSGGATGGEMMRAIVAADPRLFVAASAPSAFGTSLYAIGYDLNNNGVTGIRIGTNMFTGSAFTNGWMVWSSENKDASQSLDPGDLFWSGWSGPSWESWQEQGGAGGFHFMPQRGPSSFWTTTDTNYFSAGAHGQWDLTWGLDFISLRNGSWIGLTVAGGGLNFSDPADPGTIAYNLHKQAPPASEPASTASPYAVQLVLGQGPFDPSPYDDPTAVLGRPATRFYESSAKPFTRVKLVEPACNFAPDRTNKLLVTLLNGSAVIAKFGQPVVDHPANPYSIDFQVFGNAFFAGGTLADDNSNLNTVALGTLLFTEPMKVSVSPGFTGKPGEDPGAPETWPWYRYENGPYCDTAFPTHAYKWHRAAAKWSDELMDFTKPVNPALSGAFAAGGMNVADGIDLYDGSGGGTGFDLKPSGFASIQYIRVEGLPGFDAGEADAFAAVRRATLGDSLSIAPANLTAGATTLCFQQPGNDLHTAAAVTFTTIGDIARLTATRFDDPAALGLVAGAPVNAVDFSITRILGSGAPSLRATIALSPHAGYSGNGSDLRVYQWTGSAWNQPTFTFDFTNKQVVLSDLSELGAFVVAQLTAPPLNLEPGLNGGFVRFTPTQRCVHVLERSTNLASWTPIATNTPTSSDPVTVQDHSAPAGMAFYRLRVSFP